MVLFNLAYVCIVEPLPHDLELLNFFSLLLFLFELLDELDDLISQLDELLALFHLAICFNLSKVTKSALFDSNMPVYLLCAFPEVSQVLTLRLQPRIQPSS